MDRFNQTKIHNLDDLYVTTGEKLYVVGSQDGLFPNFGRHSVNEMGGIWCHPFKLADGFFLSVKTDEEKTWLKKSKSITVSAIDTKFNYNYGNFEVVRKQWVPDNLEGLVVSYHFHGLIDDEQETEVDFILKTELMGAWLSERLGIERGEDLIAFDDDMKLVHGKNSMNDYHLLLGTDGDIDSCEVFDHLDLPEAHYGQGKYVRIRQRVDLSHGNKTTLKFYIVGARNKEDVYKKYKFLQENEGKLYEDKLLYYQKKIHHSKLTSENKDLDRLFNIMKINTNWLIKDVDGVGRGLVAGLPDYPWYFGCDSSYAIPALLSIGEFQLAKDTLRILRDFSEKENGNGRVVHEISTNGVVPNKGNTQETPHFIIAVKEVYRWTQDIDFLKDLYPYCEKGMNWLLEEMDPDGDLFPTGYGIMEIAGLKSELIDTAVYTAEALKAMAEMAKVLGRSHDFDEYINLHLKAKESVNDRFYMEEEGLYGDCIATANEVSQAFEMFRERLDKMMGGEYHHKLMNLDRLKLELDQSQNRDEEKAWLIYKNWVGLTPLEVGYATVSQAESVLKRMTSEEYMGDYGIYIEGLTQKIMMTISTAVLAICQGRYGKIDDMMETIDYYIKSLNKEMPLSLSELMPKGGCVVQGWTILGTGVPIVNILFGVEPSMEKDNVHFKPNLPNDWNEASLENIKIGDSRLSVYYKKVGNKKHFTLEVLGQHLEILEDVDENTVIEYR